MGDGTNEDRRSSFTPNWNTILGFAGFAATWLYVYFGAQFGDRQRIRDLENTTLRIVKDLDDTRQELRSRNEVLMRLENKINLIAFKIGLNFPGGDR